MHVVNRGSKQTVPLSRVGGVLIDAEQTLEREAVSAMASTWRLQSRRVILFVPAFRIILFQCCCAIVSW